MILGFNKQFNSKIITGSKIHTIRLDLHNRWKPGNSIQFYNDVRTKKMARFREDGLCISVQKVKLKLYAMGHVMIYIDNRDPLFREQAEEFIKSDGFDNIDDFCDWFFPGKRYGTFKGKLIHWTVFKY